MADAGDLVKEVDAAVKAAGAGEAGRACDSMALLAKQDVTAQLLLSTGAGKKVQHCGPAWWHMVQRSLACWNITTNAEAAPCVIELQISKLAKCEDAAIAAAAAQVVDAWKTSVKKGQTDNALRRNSSSGGDTYHFPVHVS